jgi:hypothetical protein
VCGLVVVIKCLHARNGNPPSTTTALRSGADDAAYKYERDGRIETISLTRKGLIARVARNPVASAMGFLHYTRGLFRDLIGMEEEKHSRKTVPLARGVFGRVVGGAVAFEAQGKGASVV